jgi:hypothetical protein
VGAPFDAMMEVASLPSANHMQGRASMKRAIRLAYLAMFAAATPVVAQDKPFSMVGTWIGKGEAITMGDSLHPEHSHNEDEPKVVRVTLRLEVDKQSDGTFSGRTIGPSGKSERLIGAITEDRKRGVTMNPRGGKYQFVVVDANTLEACYSIRHGAQFYAAGCLTWRRQ